MKIKKELNKKTPLAPTPARKSKRTPIMDVLAKGNQYKYKTPLDAYDGLITKFLKRDPVLFEDSNGAELTNDLYTSDLTLYIEDPHFEDDFDFGYYFNYSATKWTSLLNNYIDLDKLDKMKNHIRELEKDTTKNRNYNIGLHFADVHSNGKGCILSGVLSRHYYIEKPSFTISLRSSEIVTRLPFDLLFFTRLGEYIFGHEKFTIKIEIKQAFADDNVILMYNNRTPLKEIYQDCEDQDRATHMLKKLKELMVIPEEDYTNYQAHLRTFKVLRTDLYPDRKSMLASQCIIGNWDGIPLPDVCPSIIDRNNIKTMYLKFVNKYGLNMEKITDPKKKKRKVIKIR